jgi:hypothetical protein
MKKLVFCLVLLLISTPVFAIGTGMGISLGGGIDMMVSSAEGAETETYPQIAGALDFSLPGMPMGLRAGVEYAWKSYDVPILGEYKATMMIILLAGQYNVVLPGAPMSFYLGAGGEMAMASTDIEGSESETNFGFLAYGGANYSMGGIGLFAEVGYGMIFSDPSLTHIPIKGGIKINL